MFELCVKMDFAAAHQLVEYKGKCENLHGHNWKIDIYLQGESLNKEGMLIDFHDIKDVADRVLDEFDHKYLNELDYFKNINPTSENIAKYLFQRLADEFKKHAVCVVKVSIWESDDACASYFNI
jgi:6-pyruvoyltetrahydropterin/6-carboxytetrahydropterin synthase